MSKDKLFNDLDLTTATEEANEEIKDEHLAFYCECGSVKFAIRKDHKLECCKCGWVVDDMSWVSWNERQKSFLHEADYEYIKKWYCQYAKIEDNAQFWNKPLKACTHSSMIDLLEDAILNFIRREK